MTSIKDVKRRVSYDDFSYEKRNIAGMVSFLAKNNCFGESLILAMHHTLPSLTVQLSS